MADSLNLGHYEAQDIKRILGVDKNKLFYWIKTYRLLTPEVEEALGTGTRAKFSIKNLFELAVIKEMIAVGLDLSSIKQIKDRLDRPFKKYKRNVFDYLVSSDVEDRESFLLEIRKSGTNINISLREMKSAGISVLDYIDVWKEPEDTEISIGKEFKSYTSFIFEIGMLADDLLKMSKGM